MLADLGSKIAVAMRKMTQTTVIDQTVMNEMLTEICKALLQADVNIAQVRAGRSAHDRSGSRLKLLACAGQALARAGQEGRGH